MPLARTFLDWNRPALPAVAEFLVERYGGEGVADLSGVVVVLTGRRASRRLLELLLEQTDGRLIPPAMITEGEFPELLYEPQRPFAGRLVQHLAWAEAVRRMPRPQAEQVLREIPDDNDVDGRMALGELLWRLHRELAAELLNFGDVLNEGTRIAGFNERRRWEALRVAQQEYLDLLDGLGLWDKQTARIVAVRERECQTDRDIVLVGTVDLNRSTRAMLDQVQDRVTALIHAPASLSERFDEHGCLRPEQWMTAPIEMTRDQVHVVDQPSDQADEVVRVLAGFDGQYRADEITIGLADDGLVPLVQRRLREYDVPTRWVVGKTLPQTGVIRLLEAVAEYLESERADRFAVLVRHPDITTWLADQGVGPEWLLELDRYLNEHLQQRLGFWLGHSDRCAQVRRVYDLVTGLLAEFRTQARPLSEWSPLVLGLLTSVLGERAFDPEVPSEKMEMDAIGKLHDLLATHDDIPDSMMPVVTGAQALRLTIDELSSETVPPPPDKAAVELLGWLELPLDDAPAMVVTSFNEEYVPSSIGADLFLPDRLRQQLGLLDNDRRYARDAYTLSTMLASRKQVVLISGQKNARGDPLLPSRLFFACEPEEVAKRVKQFALSGQTDLSRTVRTAIGCDTTPAGSEGFVIPRPRPLIEPVKSISVTHFRYFLECPYRFYLRVILGLEPMHDEAEEMDGRAFGNLLHDVLRDFGRSEFKDSMSLAEISEFLQSTLEELSDQRYGRACVPAVRVQIEQARRRLCAFANWQAERAASGWRIEFVEVPESGRPVPFPVDEHRSILLRGRIDRIDRHQERDEWALLDYKSGDTANDPEDAHRKQDQWTDLQLPLYRHLAAEMGVQGHVTMGYIALPKDTEGVIAQMAAWSEADLNEADQTAREVARMILDEEFLPITDPPPNYAEEYAAICQDNVFDRRLPE